MRDLLDEPTIVTPRHDHEHAVEDEDGCREGDDRARPAARDQERGTHEQRERTDDSRHVKVTATSVALDEPCYLVVGTWENDREEPEESAEGDERRSEPD